MHFMARRPTSLAASWLLVLLLTGCSALSHFQDPSSAPAVIPAIHGTVIGGQNPVTGATIQLYAASATTDKGASQALITGAPVISGAGGTFSITGTYTCPSSSSLVYLVATGGNPGLSGTVNNTGIALAAVLGTCGNLLANANTTNIILNELTTVAMVEAFASFMTDLSHVGANATLNPNALSGAFASASAIVNTSTGAFVPSVTGGPAPPYALYNTLANILAACINTVGNTGNTSVCYKLFNATGLTADTIAAMLYMAQNPATNVSTIFALAGGTGAPFQPAFTSQPVTFVPALLINVPNNGEYRCCTSQMLSIDTAQQVWVGNFVTHTVHTFSNSGALLYTITLPQALVNMASDPLGNTWFVVQATSPDTSYSILKYDSSGNLQSSAAGWKANVGAGVQLYTYAGTAKDNEVRLPRQPLPHRLAGGHRQLLCAQILQHRNLPAAVLPFGQRTRHGNRCR